MNARTQPALTVPAPVPGPCDAEPIHRPDAIQPHGALVAVTPADLKVRRSAGAIADLLGIPGNRLTGRSVRAVLGPHRCERLSAALANGTLTSQPVWLFDLPAASGRGPVDVIAYLASGLAILEFELREPARLCDPSITKDIADAAQRAGTIDAWCDALAAQVRAHSGFDRAVVYRFLPDGHGKVLSESRRDDIAALAGMHFPASDIPRQARALYLHNRFRIIPDARYVPAPILPPSPGPLELSQSELRSVSAWHREYLCNMGVAASMSLSIIVEDQLWGLVACHHLTPRTLPFHLRDALKRGIELAAINLEIRLQTQILEASLTRREMLRALDRPMGIADFLGAIPAGGAAYHNDGSFGTLGAAPDEAQCAAIAAWLDETGADSLFHTESLPLLYPPATAFAERACGLLAISVGSDAHRNRVFWFRPETARTVVWAGSPALAKLPGTDGESIHPRTDFSACSEVVRLHAEPWEETEIDAARRLRTTLRGRTAATSPGAPCRPTRRTAASSGTRIERQGDAVHARCVVRSH